MLVEGTGAHRRPARSFAFATRRRKRPAESAKPANRRRHALTFVGPAGRRMAKQNTRHTASKAAAAAAAADDTPSTSRGTPGEGRLDMYDEFQAWAMKTYGDSAKTKTVTRRKYNRILKILKGEEHTNTENSKFRFWVKAKGFRVGPPPDAKTPHGEEVKMSDQVLYVPCSRITPGEGKEETVFKKVAVVENFFDIIYGVHVEMDGRGGKHAGQKRTYKAIAETYAFLPREAVTHFLMSCADCQKRMHLASEGAANRHHGNEGRAVGDSGSSPSSTPRAEGGSPLEPPAIDYSLPITTTYLKHMRSLGYSEEDALNPDREDSISNAESEGSDEGGQDGGATGCSIERGDDGGADDQESLPDGQHDQGANEEDEAPLDMSRVKVENGHSEWPPSDEPINMTSRTNAGERSQDFAYEGTTSCNGCVPRESSATPDNLSAGTKDEDEEDDDDDTDRLDSNNYDPERLKAFNMFVRLFVDENLDRMVPISRQPKEKIQAIIDSCSRQFPEFGERARKRIRTYLKSCRRTKRTRDQTGWETGRSAALPHLTSALAEQILATACENECQNAKRMRLGLKPIAVSLADVERSRAPSMVSNSLSPAIAADSDPLRATLVSSSRSSHLPGITCSAATMTTGGNPCSTMSAASLINGAATLAAASQHAAGGGGSSSFTPQSSYRNVSAATPFSNTTSHNGTNHEMAVCSNAIANGPTDLSMKKPPSSAAVGPASVTAPPPNSARYSLNPSEVAAVKQLIAGYRESAAFLLRSADELEQLLLQQN